MNGMFYSTKQKVVLICSINKAREWYYKGFKNLKVVGLDCEWNQNPVSKISLLQIATPDFVFLIRIFQFENPELADFLKDFLNDRNIIKVGVNIQEDAKLLHQQYGWKVTGWVDLRNIALTRQSYGNALLAKLKSFEEELSLLYPEHQADDNLLTETHDFNTKQRHARRYAWNPKLGLSSLASDCLGLSLPKSSKVRWKANWEAYHLSDKQINYAAADGAVALDIFYTLCLDEEIGKPVNLSDYELSSEAVEHFEQICDKLKDLPVISQGYILGKCYSLITSIDKEFNLSEYIIKPAKKSKSKVKMNPGPAKKARLAVAVDESASNSSPQTKPLYENCKLLAPDGLVLCTCNRKTIDWYLNSDLAKVVDQPEGVPPIAQLLLNIFNKESRCCCCDRTNNKLVRKSIIPGEYRKHLPEEFEHMLSQDVVLLCNKCHCSSNMFDNTIRDELAHEYGIPVNYKNTFIKQDKTKSSVRAAAKALTSTSCNIPEPRRAELLAKITDYLGKTPTTEELLELKDIEVVDREVESDHGGEVVRRLVEEAAVVPFIWRWREAFVNSMKPHYLPKGWSVDHKTRDEARQSVTE